MSFSSNARLEKTDGTSGSCPGKCSHACSWITVGGSDIALPCVRNYQPRTNCPWMLGIKAPRVFPRATDVKGVMSEAVIPIQLRYLESKGISVLPKRDYRICRARLLTAIPSSTYLIPVLWTTVLSHCSYSEAGRGKIGETHCVERRKNFEN